MVTSSLVRLVMYSVAHSLCLSHLDDVVATHAIVRILLPIPVHYTLLSISIPTSRCIDVAVELPFTHEWMLLSFSRDSAHLHHRGSACSNALKKNAL